MKTEKKKKCKTDCSCKSQRDIKAKSCKAKRNGKGDKPRPSDKNQYDQNYESINWSKEIR